MVFPYATQRPALVCCTKLAENAALLLVARLTIPDMAEVATDRVELCAALPLAA